MLVLVEIDALHFVSIRTLSRESTVLIKLVVCYAWEHYLAPVSFVVKIVDDMYWHKIYVVYKVIVESAFE